MSTKDPKDQIARSSHLPDTDAAQTGLSETLEDYLEIILMLARKHKVVRVKEIAKAKSVRMPTVTSALRRLSDKGLVLYAAREYVELTPEGSDIARRIAGRHHFLTIFLERILRVSPEMAENDACGLEHHLSTESLSRLAAFVEYIDTCKNVSADFLNRFHDCFMVPESGRHDCGQKDCPVKPVNLAAEPQAEVVSIDAMSNGIKGEVVRLKVSRQDRSDLISAGFLPGALVRRIRPAIENEGIVVSIQGHEITLPANEAAAVFVRLRSDK